MQVGGRRAKLKTTTQRIEGPGFTSVQLEISRSAAKLLRGANQATVQASARATDGGPAITATGTLGR